MEERQTNKSKRFLWLGAAVSAVAAIALTPRSAATAIPIGTRFLSECHKCAAASIPRLNFSALSHNILLLFGAAAVSHLPAARL